MFFGWSKDFSKELFVNISSPIPLINNVQSLIGEHFFNFIAAEHYIYQSLEIKGNYKGKFYEKELSAPSCLINSYRKFSITDESNKNLTIWPSHCHQICSIQEVEVRWISMNFLNFLCGN